VGVGGAVVDLAMFNVLVYWGGHGPMFDQPVTAKVVATLLATVATYFGNAWLTYRDRPTKLTAGRMAVYLLINVAAIGLQAACLATSRYVFGLHGPAADNISGPLIGQILATAFRYVAYPRLVFVEQNRTGTTNRIDIGDGP
jgi:putative flippase GtrA